MNSKILCIRPLDTTTNFLQRIGKRLASTFPGYTEFFEIEPSDGSHDVCLKKITSLSESGLLIFLGHGTNEYLQGAVARNTGNAGYQKKEFISEHNIALLKNRKIFCLSCHSANGLGAMACANGARAFLGFGDLPTELNEFEGKKPIQRIVNDFKGIIQETVREGLIYGINNNVTFSQLVSYLKLLLNRKHAEIILVHKDKRDRRALADLILEMKTQIKVFGDPELTLLE